VAEGNGGVPFWMTRGLDITTSLYAGGLAVVANPGPLEVPRVRSRIELGL